MLLPVFTPGIEVCEELDETAAERAVLVRPAISREKRYTPADGQGGMTAMRRALIGIFYTVAAVIVGALAAAIAANVPFLSWLAFGKKHRPAGGHPDGARSIGCEGRIRIRGRCDGRAYPGVHWGIFRI